MAFTSHIFLFYFLPVVLLAYYTLPPRFLRTRNVLLLAAAYVSYVSVKPSFAALLLGLTLVNYVLSRLIARCQAHAGVDMAPAMGQASPRERGPGARSALLLTACAVTLDLAVLGFFKYAGFFEHLLGRLVALTGMNALPALKIVLPVGISFYTFKLISYLVDTYRGQPPARSLLDFACYVSFFPQLLSGPIQRYGTIDSKSEPGPTFAGQLLAREHTLDKFARGVVLFMLGFAKKILLANAVAQVADVVFAAQSPSTLDVWFGALAYTFQLYFDFSAYSEMAIGTGLMLGFECPRNFDAPYRADSFGDFWRRWHISLSSWLRDYLYIPLGGSLAGTGRTYLNLMIVFLLCGLWHGAGWTFLVWGAWHGLWLVVERICGRKPFYAALPAPARVLATLLLVTIGWVLFRAQTLPEAGRLLTLMFVPTAAQDGSTLLSAILYTRGHLLGVGLCALLVFQPVQGFDWTRRLDWSRVLVPASLFVLSLMTLFAQSFRPFLYSQF
jgi:alginate O-acetyltransferase complex protein AlgI